MSSPFRFNFTNYYDLKSIQRTGSWDDKVAATEELEERERLDRPVKRK